MQESPQEQKQRIIKALDNEQDMFDTVRNMYEDDGHRFFRNCNLLWIHQDMGELWTYRSNHLSMSLEDIRVAQEVLLPLNLSAKMEPCRAHGMTEEHGTELGGTQTEPTD